jgi:FkbM family methyltransferase
MAAAPTGLDAFLDDIAPYFYRRALTYVDIGAFRGEVLERILASKLKVREAHLVEPNPVSLAEARERLAGQFKGHRIEFHAMAMGAEPGRVRMSAAKSMSKVLSEQASVADGGTFEIECGTLDRLAENVTDRHIALLKVDVEGFEDRVLAGAGELLRREAVDVIYIEAGMNPEGTQQCYYRRIEDILVAHGYRLFRIYEQQHEWMADSPLLRRVNMAFFSRRFADANPYQVTKELVKLRGEFESAQARATAAEASAVAQRQAAEAQLATAIARARAAREAESARLQHLLSGVTRERDEARARAASAEAAQAGLKASRALLDAAFGDMVHATGEMVTRVRSTQSALHAARSETAKLQRSRAWRMVRALATHLRSPGRWPKLPAALRAAAIRAPRAPAVAGTPDDPKVFALLPTGARASLTFPLVRQTHLVALPGSESTYEVWVTAFAADAEREPHLDLTWSAGDAGATTRIEVWNGDGTRQPLAAGGVASYRLSIGRPLCLLRVDAGGAPTVIEISGRGATRVAVRLHLQAAGDSTQAARMVAPVDGQASSEELDAKLWGGYAADAMADLERRKLDPAVPTSEREAAAWYRARWFFVEEDFARTMAEVEETYRLVPKPNRRLPLLEAQCLLALGRAEEAGQVIERTLPRWPDDKFDLIVLRSNVARALALQRGASPAEAEAAQLDALNVAYRRAGLATLRKLDPAKPLSVSNLAADALPTGRPQTHKVSVVLPAYAAEGSIEWVLDSLLRQTWRNLEIIVVDDCSPDGTCEVVERVAARDPRVRLIRKSVNEGAYPTRNVGARAATGHYITVHDSDDWSHPQKIELEVAALELHPNRKAVITHWIRVAENLEIVGPWIPRGNLFDVNFSSLMFERSLLDRMGVWDTVKISGDAEFFYRMRALFGDATVLKLPSRQLLSLSLAREDSLTRAKATHLRSLYYGLRWNYRDAYLGWIGRIGPDGDAGIVEAATGRRRFPVPIGCLPKRPDNLHFGLVVVGDFAEPDEALWRALGALAAAHAAGRRVAVLNWRKYERPARAPLQPAFYRSVLETGAEILSPGDAVDADLVLVADAAVANHRIDPLPTIRTARCVAVVDAIADTDGAPGCRVERARTHLHAAFGVAPRLMPARPVVADALGATALWTPMAALREAPITDRSLGPRLGWVGSDDARDWLGDAAALRQASGEGGAWGIVVHGSVQPAVRLLGALPAHWRTLPVSEPIASLVDGIHIYLHQPSPLAPAVLPQALVDAMAAGRPVVAPARFRALLGDAAVYADPAEVAGVVRLLWSDEGEYAAAAARAQDFVRRAAPFDALLERSVASPARPADTVPA